MSKLNHESELFESSSTEQREFADWLRRIGGGQSEVPLVAKKGIGAAFKRIEPQIKRAVAAKAKKPGMAAEKVCWIQNVLNKTIGEALVEDGIYGPATRAGVVRFQTGNSLAADGIYGPATRAGVVRFQTGNSLAADGIVGPRTEVALIQAALNQIARASLVAVSGVLDPPTSQEIRRFQSARNLAPDGIVGPRTRAAMVAALGGRCKIMARRPGPAPGPGPKPGAGWTGGAKPPRRPGVCDQQRFDAMVEQCRNDAIQAGLNCLTKFGLGVSDAASILTPLVELAAATGTIPVINVITAAIAVFAAAYLSTTQILEAAGCVENVIKNMLSCQEAARFTSGC